MMGKTLATVIWHIVGLGCLAQSSGFYFWMYLNIVLNGFFPSVGEPNQLVLALEVASSVVSVCYVAYLLFHYVVLLRMIPRQVRKEMKLE